MSLCSALIIDDSEDDRYLLKRQLELTGLTKTIFEANNGKTALDLLTSYEENVLKYPGKFPPILIFVDINMPIINGLEFLKAFSELRKKKELNSCVLMMFTSSEREQDKKEAMSYEFVRGYIVKMPPTPDELKKNIIQACPELF